MKCLMKHLIFDEINNLNDDLDIEMSKMNDDVNIKEAKIMKKSEVGGKMREKEIKIRTKEKIKEKEK
ncbi:hypothetical protein RhiirA1_458925 [Rhizophagus irregularis]|uniref:Uncharacterized protein n=1 Tax=Rhizophagus irregularis TaxID=588596 RepID=A0A2N0RUS2_9GLOM|nr:hypothetical protein RhiirA1_458925 [Rhizophagus irregularis]